MIKVGECYYHQGVQHIVIAVSEREQKILVVSITSNNFDCACKIEPDEIIDNNGKMILTHTSYVGYRFAFEFENFKTFEQFRKIFNYRCNVSEELLKKIRDNARNSKYLQPRLRKYFE